MPHSNTGRKQGILLAPVAERAFRGKTFSITNFSPALILLALPLQD
jgi:hypothetical protein